MVLHITGVLLSYQNGVPVIIPPGKCGLMAERRQKKNHLGVRQPKWEEKTCMNVPSNVKWRMFFMHFCLVVFTCLCICHFCFSSISKHKIEAKKSHQRKRSDGLLAFLMQQQNDPLGVYEYTMNPHVPFLFSFIWGSNTDDPCSYCRDTYSTVHVGVYHAVYATWYEHSSKDRNVKCVSVGSQWKPHCSDSKNQCYNVAQFLLLRHDDVHNLPYIWIFFPFFLRHNSVFY